MLGRLPPPLGPTRLDVSQGFKGTASSPPFDMAQRGVYPGLYPITGSESSQAPSVCIPNAANPPFAVDTHAPDCAPTWQSHDPLILDPRHAHTAPMDPWQMYLHNLAYPPLWIHTCSNDPTSHCSRRGHVCLNVLHDWVGVSRVMLPFEDLMDLSLVAVGETPSNDPPSQGWNSEPGPSSYKRSHSSCEAEPSSSSTIVGSGSAFSVSPPVGPSFRAPEHQQATAPSSTSASHCATGKRKLSVDDSENRPKRQRRMGSKEPVSLTV